MTLKVPGASHYNLKGANARDDRNGANLTAGFANQHPSHPISNIRLIIVKAQWGIVRHLLEKGNGLLRIECATGAGPAPSCLTIHLDKSLVATECRRAVNDLLLRMHLYKCTGDAANGKAHIERLTKVEGDAADWHAVVGAAQEPAQLIVQANTFRVPGQLGAEIESVVLREYPATHEGIVRSWAERVLGPNLVPN